MFRFPQRFVLSGVAFAVVVTVGLTAWALATGSSEAQSGSMHNCPQVGKWSIAVWDGQDGTAAADALATCGPGAVEAAYSLDAQTGGWARWFAGKPEASNLPPFSDIQGVLALGGTAAMGAAGAERVAAAEATGQLRNCPPAGKWSIAVWDGTSGTAAADALATCGAGAVDAAYSLDPQTGSWSRWFAGLPEASNLPPFSEIQGVLALGAAATPTPMLTPTPSPTPTPTLGAVSAKEAYPLALQVARAEHPDADLEGVLSGCHTGLLAVCHEFDYYRLASGDGRSTYWRFLFYVWGAQIGEDGFAVPVVNGQPMEGYTFTHGGSPHPFPLEEVIDSTEAVRIADAHGGTAYKAASPGGQLCGAEVWDWGGGLGGR